MENQLSHLVGEPMETLSDKLLTTFDKFNEQAAALQDAQELLVHGGQERELLVVVEDRRPRAGAVVGETEALCALLVEAQNALGATGTARAAALFCGVGP